MSLTVEEFQRMKRKKDEDERDKNRAEGQKTAILKRLREEYECKNAKEAGKILAEKKAEAAKLEEALAKQKAAYMEVYGDDF